MARVLTAQAARFPEIEAIDLDTTSLPPVEHALAFALYDAAVRRWLTLEFLLETHLRRPFRELEPALRAVMLVGAAQLLLFDRVPAHAAIDEAVEWAKRRIRPGAGAMVNAVLRRVAESLGEVEPGVAPGQIPVDRTRSRPLRLGRLPNDRLDALAIETSMPAPVLRRWRTQMSYDQARSVCVHGLAKPPTVLNTAHLTAPLPDGATEPHEIPGHAVWTGTHDRLASLLATRRDVWAQDPASAGAVRAVAELTPRLIADLCAGQGTKTRQLAAVFPDASIIATDVDRTRFSVLSRTFDQHPRVRVLPPAEAREALLGQTDLVLLDVPCSNTGVLGRRVEARYRATPAALDRLVGIQRQLIADALPLLGPAGRILYATCSIERTENEDIAAWAATWHSLGRSHERRILPGAASPASSTDGAYSVVLAHR